ncbi:unnamed protein product, partial [Discosporangium mesarthrocarpum]
MIGRVHVDDHQMVDLVAEARKELLYAANRAGAQGRSETPPPPRPTPPKPTTMPMPTPGVGKPVDDPGVVPFGGGMGPGHRAGPSGAGARDHPRDVRVISGGQERDGE